MSRPATLGALVAVLGAAACQEPPSFRARWHLEDREGAMRRATAPLQCTELGINTVRIRSIDAFGLIADESYYPCFARGFDDPDATVAGPTLDPGPYAIEVRGVQRNLEPWQRGEPADDAPRCDLASGATACNELDIACACAELEVVDEQTARFDEPFALAPAPPECVDGIDNDTDGLLDANDPGCRDDPFGSREGLDISVVQFNLLVSLFGGSEFVTCLAVGLGSVRARLSGACVGDAPPADIILPCTENETIFFDADLAPGQCTLELTGQVGQGDNAMARTTPVSRSFEVIAGNGAQLSLAVDFGVEDFDPPVVEPAKFEVRFGLADGAAVCTATAVTEMALEVLDAHGGPLADPVTLADGSALDGSSFPCAAIGGETHSTEALTWGGYWLRVVGRAADGTVCFTTDGAGPDGVDAPLPLVPKNARTLVVPPVLDGDGNPPTGCGG